MNTKRTNNIELKSILKRSIVFQQFSAPFDSIIQFKQQSICFKLFSHVIAVVETPGSLQIRFEDGVRPCVDWECCCCASVCTGR